VTQGMLRVSDDGSEVAAIEDKSTIRSLSCQGSLTAVDFSGLPLPACFTTGQPSNQFRLCRPRERWQSMVGKPGTRGITSSEIGVVESYLVDPHPVRKPWRE